MIFPCLMTATLVEGGYIWLPWLLMAQGHTAAGDVTLQEVRLGLLATTVTPWLSPRDRKRSQKKDQVIICHHASCIVYLPTFGPFMG